MKNSRLFTALLASCIGLTGCAPLIIGGAATGVYLASQERGAKTAVIDTKIKTHIKDRLTNANYKYLGQVDVIVLQGNVLLTGVVPTQNDVDQVVEITKGIPDVKNVYNELIPGVGYNAKDYANDSWLATQLRTRLTTAGDIYTINYFTNVVKGNAYIMGISLTSSEKERALHIARTTKGIGKVYDYVNIIQSSPEVISGDSLLDSE